MVFSGNFGKIDPRFYFEVFQIALTAFKMNLGLFIPNCPQTHAITNTNIKPSKHDIFDIPNQHALSLQPAIFKNKAS